MPEVNWKKAASALQGFGGTSTSLKVYKTGLPFYDALRLYGAIDLYIGLRQDICINDRGDHWAVSGPSRAQRFKKRDIYAFKAVYKKKTLLAEEFCEQLQTALNSGSKLPRTVDPEERAPTDSRDRALDPVLQTGIRGLAATDYESMNSTSKSACIAKIPLSDAVLAYAGLRRTEIVGDMQFLPIFEGQLDLGKIVSPLRASLATPNPLCAHVLMLLSLETALWSEGYADRLSGVAYRKSKSRDFNYSGLIQIDSTAIGRIKDGDFCSHLLRVFRRMTRTSWKDDTPAAKALRQHTVAAAEWLMQPLPKTLAGMMTAQEILIKSGDVPMLSSTKNVRGAFDLTYANSSVDHESIRALAQSVSSAIRKLGPEEDDKKKRQHWYNEVVAIRNSPTREAFRHRVLTLLEQGRSEGSWIEPFDPVPLLESMGEDRPSFERFRDYFRMYLILASAPKHKTLQDDDAEIEEIDSTETAADEEGTK